MLTAAGTLARNWLKDARPWTNVYGLARTILASATALTLLFSETSSLFRMASGLDSEPPLCDGIRRFGTYCIVPHAHLEWARWLSIAILVVVASGWRPRITGILHWWVSFSLFSSAIMVDGGDQAAGILSLLLIPVTLTDPRRSHWDHMPDGTGEARRLVAQWALALVRLQVAGIYFHAAVGKFAIEEWADGTALYYWLLHPGLGAPNWLAPILGPVLRNGIGVSLLTWSVIVLEFFLCMGLVIAKPRRKWLLVLGISLHAGIIVVHGLVSFGLTMTAALILFLRPMEQDFDFGWLGRRFGKLRTRFALASLRGTSGRAPVLASSVHE